VLADAHNTIGYVYLFRFGAASEALPHLQSAWRDDPTAANAANLIICHAALGDYQSATDVWRKTEPGLSHEERARGSELAAALAARRIATPTAAAPLADSGPFTWRCPACAARLVMGDTTFLCASCGSAFMPAPSCPCCASTNLAGAGALTAVGPAPPTCPICHAGVTMLVNG
jgi:hypothetical protein